MVILGYRIGDKILNLGITFLLVYKQMCSGCIWLLWIHGRMPLSTASSTHSWRFPSRDSTSAGILGDRTSRPRRSATRRHPNYPARHGWRGNPAGKSPTRPTTTSTICTPSVITTATCKVDITPVSGFGFFWVFLLSTDYICTLFVFRAAPFLATFWCELQTLSYQSTSIISNFT